jgi:hypothetical protein
MPSCEAQKALSFVSCRLLWLFFRRVKKSYRGYCSTSESWPIKNYAEFQKKDAATQKCQRSSEQAAVEKREGKNPRRSVAWRGKLKNRNG